MARKDLQAPRRRTAKRTMKQRLENHASPLHSVREARRRMVKRTGRKMINRLAAFVSRQGLIEDRPIHETSTFPFLATIENGWTDILAELRPLLADRAKLPPFHEISPDQKKISTGNAWKVFILFGFGVPSARNCARCPRTAQLLRTVPGLQSAWFSILGPRYHIPRHRGITKTVLRGHLGLILPEEHDQCVMQVADQRVSWAQGKCLVFDDFYPHEVWNNTDDERIILIFDFDRPMRLPGRLAHRALMWGIKRTAYFKDAERNLKDWDERLESAVARVDEMLDEKLDPDRN